MAQLTLEKILVAVDFSDHSNVALEQALHIAAHRSDAEIVLLWVDAVDDADDVGLAPTGELSRRPHGNDDSRSDHNDHRRTARDQLDRLADRVRGRDVAVQVRVASGYPDEVIVATADELAADLVVVGTRGLTGFTRFLLGSVAEKVVRMSSSNVLVARAEPKPFARLLVATDFSSASEHALQVALALAAPGAQIDILHAWQFPTGVRGARTPDPSEGPLADLRRDVISRIAKRGADLTRRYSSSSQTLEFTNLFGAAGAVIHERLESNLYDLVAMGTHGHRGFRRFLLGSVAEATVRHAPCSVLVTRDRGEHS